MKNDIIVALVVGVLQVFIIWYIVKKLTTDKCLTAGNYNLHYLTYGDQVSRLQQKLNDIIKNKGEIIFVDGNTADAVSELLDVDGFFGINTEKALQAVTGKKSITTDKIDSINVEA